MNKKGYLGLLLCIQILGDSSPPSVITITNKIKPAMITYWKYTPEFSCKVNGVPIKPESSISIPVENETLTVRYDYNFARGFHKGAKEVTFKLDSQKKDYDLRFSWDNSWRVIMPGAKPEKSIVPDK